VASAARLKTHQSRPLHLLTHQVFHAVPASITRGLPIDDYVAIASFVYFGVKSLIDAREIEDDGAGIAARGEDLAALAASTPSQSAEPGSPPGGGPRPRERAWRRPKPRAVTPAAAVRHRRGARGRGEDAGGRRPPTAG
jgi:hypothetical protein